MKRFWHIFTLVSLLLLVFSCRKSDYSTNGDFTVIRDDGFGTGTRTFKADESYLIDGLVFVNDGQTLTIEAGTVIRFKAGQADRASALIVARGGSINARGTAQNPIIFTAEADDLNGSVPIRTQGLWGGLILLGSAPVNTPSGEAQIEGIVLSEPRGWYGGANPDDNSGVLEFVSIRHAGTNIGQGNEINGLTLGGVGAATVINHVEVVSSLDDGVEFFGGTVNTAYMAVAFTGDDAFDIDLGYQGTNQFWLAIQSGSDGDRLIELDGNSIDYPVQNPVTKPLISNATLVGNRGNKGVQLISFDNYAAGIVCNSIMVNEDNGILLEYSGFRPSSFDHFSTGMLQLVSNTFFQVNADEPDEIFRVRGVSGESVAAQQELLSAYFLAAANQVADPGFVLELQQMQLIPEEDFVPPVWYDPGNPDIQNVEFAGAFKDYNWLAGWSLLSQSGVFVMD
ncbi:MAG: hypothetical protein KJ578_14195 [Bacteroidetes bacterium]|nr:hypothetical protein [Bacteroidota bacterium]MBU1579672.1 hypothetical protein [Bacteroidota bacterium]MBU2465695.1 hypothetical protein [Bacteroidota bacterium]MBU2558924.1 hypothetical protein [Bacteroidota bacterium]